MLRVEENVEPLRNDLAAADARGVKIVGMLYGQGTLEVGWWQHHSYRETVRLAHRRADADARRRRERRRSSPTYPSAAMPSAVRTRNPVLCLVAEEYLIHDLTLQKAKTMTGYDEWDKWLRADEELQALTLGRTGRLSPIEPGATSRA